MPLNPTEAPRGGGPSATGVRAGFTGHEHDGELGLINMRGRLYDPTLGQFLQPDPFVTNLTPRGVNPYAYVMNNPTTFVDPSGFLIGWRVPGEGVATGKVTGTNTSSEGDQEPVADLSSGRGGGSTDETVDLTGSNIIYYGVVSAAQGSSSGGGSGGSSRSNGAPPPDVTQTTGPSSRGFGGGMTERGGPTRTPDPGAGVGLGGPGGGPLNPNTSPMPHAAGDPSSRNQLAANPAAAVVACLAIPACAAALAVDALIVAGITSALLPDAVKRASELLGRLMESGTIVTAVELTPEGERVLGNLKGLKDTTVRDAIRSRGGTASMSERPAISPTSFWARWRTWRAKGIKLHGRQSRS
jgi:RHS repeat-associated protein